MSRRGGPPGGTARARAGVVTVLGAGPSGLAAAITLARAGRSVRVLERRDDCGRRFAGDLQGLENWSGPGDALDELRAAGLAVNFDCDPVCRLTETNGRRSEHLHFDRPAVYLVKRGPQAGSLDHGMKRQAEALGVALEFGVHADPADADIVATGPRTREVFAVAKGMVFRTDAADTAVVMFSDRDAPRGYAYLLVVRGYGCLCTVLFEEFAKAAGAFARARWHLVERAGIATREVRAVGGEGHFSLRQAYQVDGVRYVGEAAGLQDLLWGFGIRTAIRSGVLAARSVLEGFDYARRARHAFGHHLKAGVVNRFLFEALRFGDYTLVLTAFKHNGLARMGALYRYPVLLRPLYLPAWWHIRRRYPGLRMPLRA